MQNRFKHVKNRHKQLILFHTDAQYGENAQSL